MMTVNHHGDVIESILPLPPPPNRCLISVVLIDVRVAASSDKLKACTWLGTIAIKVHDTRHARR